MVTSLVRDFGKPPAPGQSTPLSRRRDWPDFITGNFATLMRHGPQTILLWSLGTWLAAIGQLDGAESVDPVMPVNEVESANSRWLSKPVIESRRLDDMEQAIHWSHHGAGEMSFSAERARDGKQSVRLRSPTKTNQPNKVVG